MAAKVYAMRQDLSTEHHQVFINAYSWCYNIKNPNHM